MAVDTTLKANDNAATSDHKVISDDVVTPVEAVKLAESVESVKLAEAVEACKDEEEKKTTKKEKLETSVKKTIETKPVTLTLDDIIVPVPVSVSLDENDTLTEGQRS